MTFAVGLAIAAIILLAAFDLWVGVANDAVNFLNSAIGSRVATRRVILTVAAAGVFVGALTSSGLMEVARRGVFDPSWFTDPTTGAVLVTSILAIYLGVMAADVLLLDLFNTFGLPTSTTVSIISELVGASIAVALWTTPGGLFSALQVIQAGPVLGIYSGIFLSVLVAFSSSAVIMFLVRLLYGRDLQNGFTRTGWIWTGASFAALAYFVIFKGIKGAALFSAATVTRLQEAMPQISLGVFLGGSLLWFIWRKRPERVLGLLILAGTGALAVAFAGNDLVNFIGPSVAAAQAVFVSGVDLSGKVPTPKWALLLAGAIMVGALVNSRKARRVTDTEIRLAAQSGHQQRFKSSPLARALVSWGQRFWWLLSRVAPGPSRRAMTARTEPPPPESGAPPYDLLRASVNLTVAALLISLGTASGLPLSTTYITFMAAMGAAMGDRTWQRDDAEQRVTGILVVLGGWVVTGFIAAGGAFIMASVIAVGGSWGVLLACIGVAFGLWRMGISRGPAEPEEA